MTGSERRRAIVRAPATAANLGPALEALGVALSLHDTYVFEEAESGFEASAKGPGADRLAKGSDNLAFRAFLATCSAFELPPPPGLRLAVELAIPAESGLGSTSAAAVAGVVAANALAGRPLETKEMAFLASELDRAENAVPCLVGGFAVCARGDDGKLEYLRFASSRPPAIVVATPRDFGTAAYKLESALPESVTHKDAARNVGRACLLVAALLENERAPLARAMEDRLHEPYRAAHVPGFGAVCAAARGAGALGAALAGAGPSILAFADDAPDAASIGEAMIAAWHAHRIEADSRVLAVDAVGATCVLDPPEPEKKRARTTKLRKT